MTIEQYSGDIVDALDDIIGRQVILVLPDLQYERLDWDPKLRKQLLRPNVLPLPEGLSPSLHPLLRTLAIRGLWQRDAVLAQNPYHRNQYEDGREPHEVFAQSRLRVMAEVVGALGATSFTYAENEQSGESSSTEAQAKVKKTGVNVEGEASFETKKALRRGLQISYAWPGHEPDIAVAESLLAEAHLDHDETLRHLVALRRGRNPHTSITEKFDLLREASSTIQLAATVRVALDGGDVKTKRKHESRIEESASYHITY